ncbi:RNA-directed DNA polymerase, eukaryota [Tanacetum coccineum]
MAVFDLNQPASSVSEEDNVSVTNSHVESVSSSGVYSFASHDDNNASLTILGTVYDSLDECIEVYRRYASEAGFGVRLSCQKRLKCGYVKLSISLVIGKVVKSLKGSSSLVHGTQTEFKNFTRGVNCFIGDSDAQMLITRFEERQEFTKGFSFDYFVEDAELYGLFWADEVAKCNYIEFGDIVSFDATYKTNKYKMVFVPFTAIDNHRRSVTVGSGLLKRETGEAYGWLLIAFKKAFIRAPNIIVTDQDGAMRLAVAAEFPESKHRLCMWHIMQKIPAKEFEDKCDKLIEEFNLCQSKRLSRCNVLGSSWDPAPSLLILHYSAMERQRQTQEKLDHQSFDSFPNLLTPLPIEDHASKVYTRSLFIRVQKEIVAGSWLCSITGMSSDEGCTVCTIDEDKVKPVGFPEVIDKENTSENVDEEINLHQKHIGYTKVEAVEKLSMEAFFSFLIQCAYGGSRDGSSGSGLGFLVCIKVVRSLEVLVCIQVVLPGDSISALFLFFAIFLYAVFSSVVSLSSASFSSPSFFSVSFSSSFSSPSFSYVSFSSSFSSVSDDSRDVVSVDSFDFAGDLCGVVSVCGGGVSVCGVVSIVVRLAFDGG